MLNCVVYSRICGNYVDSSMELHSVHCIVPVLQLFPNSENIQKYMYIEYILAICHLYFKILNQRLLLIEYSVYYSYLNMIMNE